MKKILFIPTYTYLSSPIFTNLLPALKEYETIYLDVEDQYHCEKSSDQFKNQFSRSIHLHMNAENITFVAKIMKFFKMVRYKSRLEKLIKEEAPSAIVTTGDLTVSTRILKTYFSDIPLVVIQPALFAVKGISRKYSQQIIYNVFNKILRMPIMRKQNYFGQEYKDIILLVWGKHFEKMLPNNKNIHIVGDISFDTFPIEKSIKEKKIFLAKYGYKETTNVIVICTTVENIAEKSIVDNIYDVYKNLIITRQDLFFIIKPHPRNDTKELRDIFISLRVDNCVVVNTNLHELFKYTDVHISSFSRTAIEAVASNIPVIAVNPDNEIHLPDFLNNELNEKVTNFQEMHDKIDDILNNKDDYLALGEQYIENKLYKLDGNAAQRAADIIKREIEL